MNESANAGNESFARAVSMTWATVCDVEVCVIRACFDGLGFVFAACSLQHPITKFVCYFYYL